jgi:hypothetical protein
MALKMGDDGVREVGGNTSFFYSCSRNVSRD